MTKTEHACSSCQTRKRKCETSGIGKTCVRCKDKNIQCEYSRHKRRGRKPKIESSILTMNETLQTNETNVYPQMENSSTIESQESTCETSGIGKTCVRCKDKNIQCEYSRHKRRGRKPKIESSILTMNETLQTNETNVYPQMENSSTIESQESTVPHSNNLSQKDLEELFPGI
ncbi:hypothetical protein Glove_144g134 [Diversispora epigaea]|uniref:Zn(2)-C6 fungal-type domain-containing protein n=1 Tax=Diversispora epigaea TaxID=1348612 RepID=A0A397IYU3_9GLOM|nr:hypothetical protein Glove_144g134 [Diversispora epigaea]